MGRATRAQAVAQAAWRGRAVHVLSQHVALPRHPWGGHPVDYAWVDPGDWLDPNRFPGARRVYLTWPPGVPYQARGWARSWNRAFGHPQYGPPWRWTYDPHRHVMVGSPFDLGPVIPYPPADRIDYDTWRHAIPLGVCEDGMPLFWDLLEIPHALLGGSTRFGKTNVLRLVCYHLEAANILQALVVLDWKRRDFGALDGHGWSPSDCAGVTVAKPDLDLDALDQPLPDDIDELAEVVPGMHLSTMVRACATLLRELYRRIREGERLPAGDDPWVDRLCVLVVDEAVATLQREPHPPPSDKSDQANAVRRRNRQRALIEYAISQLVFLGAAYHMHVICGAQSPRKEFLPGEAVMNMQFRMFMGPALDLAELLVVFGKDPPASPQVRKGFGVWRSTRPDVDPADPYLYFQAYWMPDELLAWLFRSRRQPPPSPTVPDYRAA